MKSARSLRAAMLAVMTCALASFAMAQNYPVKPIRLVVAFTAGSDTDIIARAVGEALSKSLRQTVVIENRPGAGGTIAAGATARAIADGYTFLIHTSAHTVNPALYSNLTYDTARDFVGVAPLANLPNVIVTPPGRYKTVRDLVKAAKANPGKLNFGSTGYGSSAHLNAEKFRAVARFDAVHIPFKGAPEALSETMAGRLDYFFAPIVSARELINDGKLNAQAVGTEKRAELLPEIPSTVELGYPGSDFNFWIGLFAPAKTPGDIIDRINQEVTGALQSPEVRARFAVLGAQPFPMLPEAFDAYVRTEIERNGKIIKAAGIKAN